MRGLQWLMLTVPVVAMLQLIAPHTLHAGNLPRIATVRALVAGCGRPSTSFTAPVRSRASAVEQQRSCRAPLPLVPLSAPYRWNAPVALFLLLALALASHAFWRRVFGPGYDA